MLLLNPKIVAGQVEVEVHGVADRRDVAGAMPGRPDVEELAAGSDLAGHAQAADRRDMQPDEVDPAVGHKRQPLVAIDEQLSHRQGSRCLRTEMLKPRRVLGRETVFEEEQAERFQRLRELDGLDRGNTLVDVVDQLDIESELRTQVLEHLDRVVDVRSGLEDGEGRIPVGRACCTSFEVSPAAPYVA